MSPRWPASHAARPGRRASGRGTPAVSTSTATRARGLGSASPAGGRRVQAAAYASGAIVLKTAEALQRAYEAKISGDQDEAIVTAQQADLEVSQAITVVSDLVLHAVTELFDDARCVRGQAWPRPGSLLAQRADHRPRTIRASIISARSAISPLTAVLPAFNWGRPTSRMTYRMQPNIEVAMHLSRRFLLMGLGCMAFAPAALAQTAPNVRLRATIDSVSEIGHHGGYARRRQGHVEAGRPCLGRHGSFRHPWMPSSPIHSSASPRCLATTVR